MKWIKCSEKLPELKENLCYSEDVLAFCVSDGQNRIIDGQLIKNTYSKDESYLSIDRLIKWNEFDMSFRADKFFGKVTHWMPLPEVPNDVE